MMRNWKANILGRRKPSQTPGIKKGERCTTGKMKKFFASTARARHHNDYARWHKKFKSMNGQA